MKDCRENVTMGISGFKKIKFLEFLKESIRYVCHKDMLDRILCCSCHESNSEISYSKKGKRNKTVEN